MKNLIIRMMATFFRFIRGEISTQRLIKMGLVVGKDFSREGGVRIDTSYCHLISIGDHVTLAPNVHILAHDASLKHFLGVSRIGCVTIGNKVFVGANSVILPRCKIGDNVIIGAGSVVTKDIPGNSVHAGNPAKFICSIDDLIKRNIDLMQDSNIFDSSQSSFSLSKEKKVKMRNALKSEFGFQECENRSLFRNSNNDFFN